VLAQHPRELRNEHDLAPAAGGLLDHPQPLSRELCAYPDETAVEVDVVPDEPERLAQAEPGEGEERNQHPIGALALEQLPEFGLVEDPLLAVLDRRALVALEPANGIRCDQTSALGLAQH
jgi:hypothetical protein